MARHYGNPILQPLDWRNGRRWYRTTESCAFESSRFGILVMVPAGFETDMGSIPTVLQPLIQKDEALWDWVIHDFNYSLDQADPRVTRKVADQMMLEGMTINGHGPIKRGMVYHACRTFGGKRWRKR